MKSQNLVLKIGLSALELFFRQKNLHAVFKCLLSPFKTFALWNHHTEHRPTVLMVALFLVCDEWFRKYGVSKLIKSWGSIFETPCSFTIVYTICQMLTIFYKNVLTKFNRC